MAFNMRDKSRCTAVSNNGSSFTDGISGDNNDYQNDYNDHDNNDGHLDLCHFKS